MKRIFFLLAMGIALGSYAQDASVKQMQQERDRKVARDTSKKQGWQQGGLFALNITQGSTSNWAAGGERFSLSVQGVVNLFANRYVGRHSWENNLDLLYALVNTTSQGTRKNDDRIDYFTKYTYSLSKQIGVGVVGNFRTQFTDGFDYNEDPKELISGFMAPAYLTVSPGFNWAPTSYFSAFLSPISSRWTFVLQNEEVLAPIYEVDPARRVRYEAGAYLTLNFNKEILKNVTLKSRLDLYSNYLRNPENIDIFWTNLIGMKVNKFLTVTYNLDLIYDDDIRTFGPNNDAPRTQIKSLLGVGVSVAFGDKLVR